MLQVVPSAETVSYGQEIFPSPSDDQFDVLFKNHGIEVRGRPFDLDFNRYQMIQMERRLVWIVARANKRPIGYACSFWYRDLHFDEKVAADDLWFVKSEHRGSGIGRTLKVMSHIELVRHGVKRVYDTIRTDGCHHSLMTNLNFKPWGIRWHKDL
jgi:hypothetical protein